MTADRDLVLNQLGEAIAEHADPSSITLVALTGITACGKTTLAKELTGVLTRMGRSCINIDVDGFHNPREVRHQLGRDSAEGYYYDAYNYDLLKRLVLDPLSPGGNLAYRTRGFDLDQDRPVDDAPVIAAIGDIFLFSASFLFRPEVVSYFGYKIFVSTSFDIAEQRGVTRDAERLGSIEQATRMFQQRYHAAQHIYLQEANPIQQADAIIHNNNLERPTLFLRVPKSG